MKSLPARYSCLVSIGLLFLFASSEFAQQVVTVSSNKRGQVKVAALALPVAAEGPVDTSQTRENLTILTTKPDVEIFGQRQINFCSTWNYRRPRGRLDIKAVGALDCGANELTPCYWTKPIILVGFVNGTPELKQAVKEVVAEWTVWANVAFIIDDNRNYQGDTADIKISFNSDSVHNSYVGIDSWHSSVRLGKDSPTMNLGLLGGPIRSADGKILPWVKGTILHEFGHALGLKHEHQSPAGGIQWNREEVIKELQGPPSNWSLQTIENNIFRALNRDLTQFTRHDPSSVMHYSFPANWTKNGVAIPENNELSETDKSFIAQKYQRRKASIDTSQYYRLTTWSNNRQNCLGVGVVETAAGKSYVPYFYACDNASSGQRWKFTMLPSGDYRLSNELMGAEFSLKDSGLGYYADMARSGNYSDQHWTITSLDKYYRLSSGLNGQTYSFTASTTPNSRVHMSRTGHWSNQLWEFVPASPVR